MGFKLSELDEGTEVLLHISNSDKSIELGAVIKKILKENVALISLKCNTTKKLVFDSVMVDMEYYQDGAVPIIWHNVKIASYMTDYALQVFGDGSKHNRRASFRVGVSVLARVNTLGRGPRQVMVRDISLTGFSLSDRKKELKLGVGDEFSISFEDLGHEINLTGRVVRIEEHEDVNIFGFEICNLCKDLSSYISIKQRLKK